MFLLLLIPASLHADLLEPVIDSIIVSVNIPISESALLRGTGLRIDESRLRMTPLEVQYGIVSNLKSLGYLTPAVEVQWPLWNDEIGIVRISADAGTRSMLSGIVFKGVHIFQADSLADLYPGAPGDPITPEDILTFRDALISCYSERGYINMQINIELLGLNLLEEDSLSYIGYRAVECSIVENSQAFLGSVSVSGLETVRQKVVTRELLISSGDSLNTELLRQSISEIYRLSLFQDVRFSYESHPFDSSVVDLNIVITESRYHRIELGTGYVSPTALFGSARWVHPNILGNNQRLTAGYYYSRYIGSSEGRRIEPEITYEEPWFLSTRWSLQLKLAYLYLSIPGLYQRSWSVTPAFARDITDNLNFNIEYSFQYETYSELDDSSETSEWHTTASIASAIVHDNRFPVLNPLRGHWIMTGGKFSGGFLSGDDYYTLRSEARFFFPLSENFVLAARIRTGIANTFGGNTTIPPDDRFFLGGGTTIRGYRLNSMGPQNSDGDPVGGRVELLGNLEARVRAVGEFGMVLFIDSGGLWDDLRSISRDTAGFGLGIGLRYNTVIGPIRLDYGFAPMRHNSLKRGEIYFGLGHAF